LDVDVEATLMVVVDIVGEGCDPVIEGSAVMQSVKRDPSRLASVAFTVAQQELHAGPNSRKVGQKHELSGHVEAAFATISHWEEHGFGPPPAVAVIGFTVARLGNSDIHPVMTDAIILASVTLTVTKH
jgi:hypothetical protein